jgi:GcrA cell cycle regulator
MEWNDETIVRLRTLWAEGLSTAEIGRRIAVSKNAVVGKAHRLGLEPRPSPIRREGSGGPLLRQSAPRRIVGPTLPPLPVSAPAEDRGGAASPAAKLAQPSPVRAAPPAPVRVAPPRTSRLVACCWPIGEPGTKSFRFCDDDALPGKPYCAEHAQLAYVKVRDRREEAA